MNNKGQRLGICDALTLILFAYKLAGIIECSWLQVFIPLIVEFGIMVLASILENK